jgi:UTP--glucose-1-phosphate uridylyltransferase
MVGNEPFAVLLPDMVMHAKPGCLSQMIETYSERGGNVIAVEEVDPDEVHRYGVVAASNWNGNGFTIDRMVEKPRREDAPSNLIISGRYILQPEIFDEISALVPGAGGEIQITDAMIRLMANQPFHGLAYRGATYDCGDKLGFLAANIAYGLEREDLGAGFRLVLEKIIGNHGGHVSWQKNPGLTSIIEMLRASMPTEEIEYLESA